MADSLFGFVSTFTDPTLAWDALHCKFASDSQSHLLMFTNQLHMFKMLEGRSMEGYVNKATLEEQVVVARKNSSG